MAHPMRVVERHVAAFGAKDADAEPLSADAPAVPEEGPTDKEVQLTRAA